MPMYKIIGYRRVVSEEKVYFGGIEADDPKSALEVIKNDTDTYELDYDCLDVISQEFSQDKWEVDEIAG